MKLPQVLKGQDMINVRCFTNRDELKSQKWPSQLKYMPVIGHRILSKSGISLEIVSITHCKGDSLETFIDNRNDLADHLLIELH